MATALPTVKSHHYPNLATFGNDAHSVFISSQRRTEMSGKLRNAVASLSGSSRPISRNVILKRDFIFLGLSSSLSLVFPPIGCGAEEEVKTELQVDETNAYSYLYPTELPSNNFVFKWNLTLFHIFEGWNPESQSGIHQLHHYPIGPPNPLFLKSNDKSTWGAKDVADSVLADKSALRVTSSQRMEESSVLDAHSSIIDGEPYWYYEYLIRKSPTKTAQESNLYRHFVAATATRDGYLYTLNASTLSKQWEKMGSSLEKTVASFRLLPPTENYVPPPPPGDFGSFQFQLL